jgi:uncharacterized protein
MDVNIKIISSFVKTKLENEPTGHDYLHALRVMHNSEEIAYDYDVEVNIIKAAALIHDLIDHKLDKEYKSSIEEINKLLDDSGFENSQINHIQEIINNLSYSTSKIPPSLEGKIVQDADRLDALGAIGIARTFAFGGKNNRLIYSENKFDNKNSIAHFDDKLLKLSGLMNTKRARLIAEERTNYMKEFLVRFRREVSGE